MAPSRPVAQYEGGIRHIADRGETKSSNRGRPDAHNTQIVTMKTLFTAEAISKGGRSGNIKTPDGLLDVTLGNPLEKGIEKRGPSPELLFAGAYSACYHGALSNAAKRLGTPAGDSTVRARVSLIEDDQGGFRLAVELHAQLPGVDRAQVQRLMDEAHKTCPYSKALRGDTSVKLVVD
jgi:osmotically inducible protein OsmC